MSHVHVNDIVYEHNTARFIGLDPVPAVVQLRTRQPTAAGGVVWVNDGEPQPEQICRIIRSANRGDNMTRTTNDGRALLLTAVAMFMPGAVVERGALLTADDQTWEVGGVSRHPAWRVTAELGFHA